MPDAGWMTPMFQFARSHQIRLDFVTWHYYGNYPFIGPDGPEVGYTPPIPALAHQNPNTTPELMGQQVDTIRVLARSGLGYVPELTNNEWNLSAGGLDKRQDTNNGAAFHAATLIAFQQHGITSAVFETAIDPFPSLNGKDLHGDLGLQTRGGIDKPSWWAFRLFGDLQPHVLATHVAGARPIPDGVWALASRSRNQNRISVMLVSWKSTKAVDQSAQVTVHGLRAGKWTAAVYRIDGHHHQSAHPQIVVRFTNPLTMALPQDSVILVRLTRVAQ